MNNRPNPWRWLVAVSLAATLLWVVVFVIPPNWFAYILDIKRIRLDDNNAQSIAWLILNPPPELLVDYEPEIMSPQDSQLQEAEPFKAQDWWNQSAAISIVKDDSALKIQVSHQDSVRFIFNHLGLAQDFMTRTQPDSVLAAKIFFLQLEDSFDFSDAKSYLSAIGRAKDYEDIMSRAAAMYDEFLQTNIMVPD